jgi:hypothetical protein
MGTMSDADLAKKLGRTTFAIQARRIALAISNFDRALHQWRPAEDVLLGNGLAILLKRLLIVAAAWEFQLNPPIEGRGLPKKIRFSELCPILGSRLGLVTHSPTSSIVTKKPVIARFSRRSAAGHGDSR